MNFEIYIVAVIWICLVTKQKPGWPWLAQFLKKILQWSLSFKILDAMNAIFDQVKIYGNKSSIFWPRAVDYPNIPNRRSECPAAQF